MSLFDSLDFPGGSRRDDPPTSKSAAKKIKADALRLKVAHAVYLAGDYGATSEEVADRIEIDLQSVSPRFAELSDGRKVFPPLIRLKRSETGEVVRRPGRSGNGRQVWIHTGDGIRTGADRNDLPSGNVAIVTESPPHTQEGHNHVSG
jgi:hypothetical protein